MFVDHLKRLFMSEQIEHKTASSRMFITPYAQQRERGIVLLGVVSDLSLGFNRSRDEAKDGPESIRQVLPKIHTHGHLPVYDAGNIELEQSHFTAVAQQQYLTLCELLQQGQLPVVLGGGHEISVASYQAVSDVMAQLHHIDKATTETDIAQCVRVGVINFDAHFELRPALSMKPGSAFHMAANYSREKGREFNYLGLGICEHANSQAMFKLADELGCRWLLDNQITTRNKKKVQAVLDGFIDSVDHIHLSVDMDVFSSTVAPAANMTNMGGVSLSVVEWALKYIMESGKVKLVDLAELNPEFDYEHRTAKLAGKLVHAIARNL
ncbi:arginase family protein [Photobacterium damselae subsp. damselae]|uniref:formimidoylglutamase n=1 Tax=Photobacterium damselae TaxID=38293 RepID=UPI00083A2222|nr:formimidoylglutamase [Photobacterium damselae]QSH58760.1 arginase family protein [Photobacterium damselae subsp. damselae]